MTSGGTESILMALKTYRDAARDRNPSLGVPEMYVVTVSMNSLSVSVRGSVSLSLRLRLSVSVSE